MQNDNKKSKALASGEEKTAEKTKSKNNSAPTQKENSKSSTGKKARYSKSRAPKDAASKSSMVAPKKIKLLFTVVNRRKTEFFVDVLQNFEVNMQLVLSAQGTASDHIISLLGLQDSNKSVIISVIRQDKIKDALAALEEKFNTVRDGKGIAYTVPIKSAIGVAIYRFLSNTSGGGLING